MNSFAPLTFSLTASLSATRLADEVKQSGQGYRPAAARKPNLFVIGAMKSGTTYLNKLLAAHPGIFMSAPEEPSYFVEPNQLRDIWPWAWDQGFWRGEEHYLRLFENAGDARFLGEASTNYSKWPLATGVPDRIHQFNPDARFIYLLRDPIERTISHYWHMVRYNGERRPILDAIRDERHYRDVSHYAMQLQPYLDLFGPDKVRIVLHERLTRSPVEVMRTLYQWLDLDETMADFAGFGQAENVTPYTLRMDAWSGLFQMLRDARPVRLLLPHVPEALRSAIVRMATRPIDRRTVDTTAVKTFLRPYQLRETEELTGLTGLTFPEWTTLYQDTAASEA